MDLMRKDIRTQKQSLVDQGMELEAAQKSQFWGIYDAYQKALTTIGDQRVANIKKFADNIDKMTDVIADELAVKNARYRGAENSAEKEILRGIQSEDGSAGGGPFPAGGNHDRASARSANCFRSADPTVGFEILGFEIRDCQP